MASGLRRLLHESVQRVCCSVWSGLCLSKAHSLIQWPSYYVSKPRRMDTWLSNDFDHGVNDFAGGINCGHLFLITNAKIDYEWWVDSFRQKLHVQLYSMFKFVVDVSYWTCNNNTITKVLWIHMKVKRDKGIQFLMAVRPGRECIRGDFCKQTCLITEYTPCCLVLRGQSMGPASYNVNTLTRPGGID